MATTKELLEEHNKWADKVGAMKLRTWKASQKNLTDRIEGLKRQAKEMTPQGEYLTISQIAASISMDPKVARAKLRRKGMGANEGRWPTFKKDSDEHADIVKLLKSMR